MKVKELISKLQKVNPDAEVIVNDDAGNFGPANKVWFDAEGYQDSDALIINHKVVDNTPHLNL